MSRREWMDTSTTLLLEQVGALTDEQFGQPSKLPDWSRAHLIAHVHYNAQALRRLLHWARTGERSPMYDSIAQRNTEITEGATLPTDRLRALVRESADVLAADCDALPSESWHREVVTAQGRTVPASEILWMRTREAAVHAIDLNTGAAFTDLPAELNTALAADAVTKRCGNGEAATLAEWLTGRTTTAPELGPWL